MSQFNYSHTITEKMKMVLSYSVNESILGQKLKVWWQSIFESFQRNVKNNGNLGNFKITNKNGNRKNVHANSAKSVL